MKIDRKLNLVIPIDDEATGLVNYVFAAPVSRVVFERYVRVIAKTFNDVISMGLQTTGPRTAMLLLRDNAAQMGIKDDVESGLVAEIRRNANIMVPGPNGWEHVPLEEAVSKGALSEDDQSEVENALAFFTVGWSMFNQKDRAAMLGAALLLWDGQITSFNSTEYEHFLKTSTQADSSGEKVTQSSIPH